VLPLEQSPFRAEADGRLVYDGNVEQAPSGKAGGWVLRGDHSVGESGGKLTDFSTGKDTIPIMRMTINWKVIAPDGTEVALTQELAERFPGEIFELPNIPIAVLKSPSGYTALPLKVALDPGK